MTHVSNFIRLTAPSMPSLATLRQIPQPTPAKFLAAHPGCWIQYYDDTPAKDPAKALSARSFNLAVARRKQQQRCALCFSLQAFGNARTKEGLLSYRNLGVDVDLVSAQDRRLISVQEIDKRKEEYLSRRLLPFPLNPHWLIETMHGFHVIFRIVPQRLEDGIHGAAALGRRLVSVLQGDENAALLTQVLRVPRTYQFKDPEHPFLCRLLVDNASTIAPYDLATVRSVLDAWEVFHSTATERAQKDIGEPKQQQKKQSGLEGVPEGQRNATAASVVGGIIGRLPERFWETAGWGGLKEWNQRNAVPLPERELRSVYESIARRERGGRLRSGRETTGQALEGLSVSVAVRIEYGKTGQSAGLEILQAGRTSVAASARDAVASNDRPVVPPSSVTVTEQDGSRGPTPTPTTAQRPTSCIRNDEQ